MSPRPTSAVSRRRQQSRLPRLCLAGLCGRAGGGGRVQLAARLPAAGRGDGGVAIVTSLAPEPEYQARRPQSLRQSVLQPLKELLGSPARWA